LKKLFSVALAAAMLLALATCGRPTAIPNPPLILGEKYLTDLDYEQALLQFDQAITIEPKNPRGYLGKYAALELAERRDEAVQALEDGKKNVARVQRRQLGAVLSAAVSSAVDGLATATEAYKSLGFRDIALKLLDVCVTVYEGVERFVLLRDVLVEEMSAGQYVVCPHGEDEHGPIYHLVANTEDTAAEDLTTEGTPATTVGNDVFPENLFTEKELGISFDDDIFTIAALFGYSREQIESRLSLYGEDKNADRWRCEFYDNDSPEFAVEYNRFEKHEEYYIYYYSNTNNALPFGIRPAVRTEDAIKKYYYDPNELVFKLLNGQESAENVEDGETLYSFRNTERQYSMVYIPQLRSDDGWRVEQIRYHMNNLLNGKEIDFGIDFRNNIDMIASIYLTIRKPLS